MRYTKLGATGLDVSAICLGCMTYGEPGRGQHSWTLNEAESRPLLAQALDSGINFFDTANVYSDGSSEEILGAFLKGSVSRDDVVIATKVNGRMRPGPNGAGLSRKAILSEIDHSLRRLQTDFVDLYQIHRWDYGTPIHETLEALDAVVKAGKARYIGASSMFAWQFSKALHLQAANGWTRFSTMQDHLNLLYREEEREMLPLCRDAGIGVLPWSPLARGRLARDRHASTARIETDEFGKHLYDGNDASDAAIIQAVGDIAHRRGATRAQVALAWLHHNPTVSAPIVGASKPEHLSDAIGSLEIDLTPDEMARLEAPYRPRPIAGFS
jgi:aryl-alcohol dehydrogenase-like predicted oxidoreductase